MVLRVAFSGPSLMELFETDDEDGGLGATATPAGDDAFSHRLKHTRRGDTGTDHDRGHMAPSDAFGKADSQPSRSARTCELSNTMPNVQISRRTMRPLPFPTCRGNYVVTRVVFYSYVCVRSRKYTQKRL